MIARIAGALLRICGWQVVGQFPPDQKLIIIIAPHTSNWDFVIAFTWGLSLGKIGYTAWFGKHTLFRRPWGGLLRRLGGIPIDRSDARSVVADSIAALERRDRAILALTPEGTRGRTDHWKSGFYRIALGSGLPVTLAFLDYPGRRVGVGPTLRFSGDVEADWRELRNFYRREWARNPEQFGEIRPKD